jgi:hypothetical protein
MSICRCGSKFCGGASDCPFDEPTLSKGLKALAIVEERKSCFMTLARLAIAKGHTTESSAKAYLLSLNPSLPSTDEFDVLFPECFRQAQTH